MKFIKGDTVFIKSGKDKGKKGKILKVNLKSARLLVEGVNIRKKHQRATQKFQGGIIEKPAPIMVCKAMLVCPRCSEPSRLSRARVCRSCGETVDKEK